MLSITEMNIVTEYSRAFFLTCHQIKCGLVPNATNTKLMSHGIRSNVNGADFVSTTRTQTHILYDDAFSLLP